METDQGVEREEILFLPPNSTFEDHLCQLQVVLRRLRRAGLKVNAEKSSFFAPEIEYLDYMLTKDGIKQYSRRYKLKLRNRPNISFLIASPNFSLTIGDNLKTCERDLGSGMKSERLICVSWFFSMVLLVWICSWAIFIYSALFISSGQFFIVVKYALTLSYWIVEGWSAVWVFLEFFVVCVCLASSPGVLWFPLLGYETRSDISEMVCFLEGCVWR